jgi:hypothetical protein
MSTINILRDQFAALSKMSEEANARCRAFNADYGKHPQMSQDEESAIYFILEKLATKLATEVLDLKEIVDYYDEHRIILK